MSVTLATVSAMAVSLALLGLAVRTLPVGTAYAVWTGIGAVGTVLVGIFFFKEPADFWRVFFIFTFNRHFAPPKRHIKSLDLECAFHVLYLRNERLSRAHSVSYGPHAIRPPITRRSRPPLARPRSIAIEFEARPRYRHQGETTFHPRCLVCPQRRPSRTTPRI